MAKLSKKSCHPEAAAPAVEPAPRVAPSREAAGWRLRRFRLFSCFQVSPKPLDKFLAETARRPRPEMAPQRLEKIESAPGDGMASGSLELLDLVHGRAADRALRPGAARTLSNSPRGAGRKFSTSQSIEIARNRIRISEASPARRTDRRSSRAASPRRRAARADPRGAGTGAVASRGPESCRKRRLKS